MYRPHKAVSTPHTTTADTMTVFYACRPMEDIKVV